MSTPSQQLDDTLSGPFSESSEEDGNKPWGKIVSMIEEKDSVMEPKSFDLRDESFSIGTDEKCQWSILSTIAMSEVQCIITKDILDIRNPVFCEDLSTCGTFVNGRIIGINKKRLLQSGDVTSFGKIQIFTFTNHNEKNDHGFGKDITDTFYIGKLLGKGSFGVVFAVFHKETNASFAVKKIEKNRPGNILCNIIFEIELVKALDHTNVIKCLDVVQQPDTYFLFLELMEGGNLLELVNRDGYLFEEEAKWYFHQLCQALRYIHGKMIIHLDIKPDNLLLLTKCSKSILKLSDFGFAQNFDEKSMKSAVPGATLYASPEMLDLRPFTTKADIWSAGVTLYVMLCGKLPFENVSSIKKGKFDLHNGRMTDVSNSTKELVKKILVNDPNTRLSIAEILMIEK